MAELRRSELAKHLRRTRGVVLQAFPSQLVLEAIQSLVSEVTLNAGNVVVLFDAPRTLLDSQVLESWKPLLGDAHLAETLHEGNAFLGTVSQFTDALRDSEHDDWVERIGLLLIPRGEDVFSRPYAWELMAFALRDRLAQREANELPRTVVIAEPRRGTESGMRDALPIYATERYAEREAWSEYTVPIGRPDAIWWTIWSSQSMRGYADGLVAARPPAFCGATGPLAQFAGRWGIPAEDNWVFYTADSGEADHHQNLQRSLNRLSFASHPSAPWQWLAAAAKQVGAVTIAEPHGNPWRALHRVTAAYAGTTLCNIVCRSRMLLPYQAANAQWFSIYPLLPITPLAALTVPFDTAVQLVQRLDLAGSLPADAVRDALVATQHPCRADDPEVTDVFRSAQKLIEEQLGAVLAAQLRWSDEQEWVSASVGGAFLPVGRLRLESTHVARAVADWLDEFEVAVEGGTVFDVVRREHASQRYWLGKVVLVEGQKFVVNKIDEMARRIQISHDDKVEVPDYRPGRSVALSEPGSWKAVRSKKEIATADGNRLVAEAFALEFTVTTDKIVVSLDHWAQAPQVMSVPQHSRRYRAGRAARVRLLRRDDTSLLSPSAAVALAAWLNEAAPTLLPEVSCFVVAAPLVLPEARPRNEIAATAIPLIELSDGHDASIAVWIFEDSHSDLGIMRAAIEEIEYLLDVCFDWLCWTLDEAPTTADNPVCLDNRVRPPRDWFSYGLDARDEAVGLSELREALTAFKGLFREVTPNRRGAHAPALLEVRGKSADVSCDFCERVMSDGQPFDVLRDGRISCNACTEVGVVQLHDLERIFHDVAAPFYREVHKVVDITNVRVELVDQAGVSEAQGERFIATSGFDMRAIALAMRAAGRLRSGTIDAQERHVVLVESGFSPEATATTLVHELCHVWQYNHLNLGALDKPTRTIYLEGHAVWTEESFLGWVAGQQFDRFKSDRWETVKSSLAVLKAGETVYGEGYRFVRRHLGVGQSAFSWMRQRYPRL